MLYPVPDAQHLAADGIQCCIADVVADVVLLGTLDLLRDDVRVLDVAELHIARVKRRDDELAQRERPCLNVKVDTWICWHKLKRVELVVVCVCPRMRTPRCLTMSPQQQQAAGKVLEDLPAVRAQLGRLGLLEQHGHSQPFADFGIALPAEPSHGIRVEVARQV